MLGTAFKSFVESLDAAPPVSIRYNPKKVSVPAGMPVPWCETGRYLTKRPIFTLDPFFHAGAYYVQEASSMFLEQAIRQTIDTNKPLKVLDLCAAPGGKSTHALSILSPDSLLVSNEAIRNRVPALVENIQKWGTANVIVTNNDPAHFQRLPSFFDLAIIDAPCSGEGLFRKEPESMNQWSARNVDLCSLRQRRIIQDVWPALKAGGVLIYSTCTYNEKENMDNLLRLREQHEVEFLPLALKKEWGVVETVKGLCFGYQFYPHLVMGEGFFLTAIRKGGNNPQRTTKVRDGLKYPSGTELNKLKEWVDIPESKCFFLHDKQVRMIPLSLKHELMELQQALHLIEVGTAVAEIAHSKLIPEHALALSDGLRKDCFRRISLNTENALGYLRKDAFTVDAGKTGFGLIDHEGLGLGWVNVLDNRVNNMYPPSRRIRMKQN